eukprot:7152485-Heterocapsa_arctica.AAC.1
MRTSTAYNAPSTHRASTITAPSPTFYFMIDVKNFKIHTIFQLAHRSALLPRPAGQGGPDDFM